MQRKFETAIVDTSCFILLSKIGGLTILQDVFPTVYTTAEIAREFGLPLPSWVNLKHVTDVDKQKLFEQEVDAGEATALALSFEIENAIVILDDLKARKFAEILSIAHTGTLGLILRAKQDGVIPSVKTFIERLKETNFYFSEEIIAEILRDAGEE